MVPIPLLPYPATTKFSDIPDIAVKLRDIASRAYFAVTGKQNHLPRRSSVPVVCVNLTPIYWQLECNDPEFDKLGEVAQHIRTEWETLSMR